MRDSIRRADGEGAIENAGQKSDPIAPARGIVLAEVTPHRRVTGMDLRHGSDYDDSHDPTDNNEK